MKTNMSHLWQFSFFNVCALRGSTLQSVRQNRGVFRHFVCTALRQGHSRSRPQTLYSATPYAYHTDEFFTFKYNTASRCTRKYNLFCAHKISKSLPRAGFHKFSHDQQHVSAQYFSSVPLSVHACEISGLRRIAVEFFALLGCYTA